VEGSELRRISCFPSHSGHRTVVHRSRFEICRGRLRPRSLAPKQQRPKQARQFGPGQRWEDYSSVRTHYLHSCRRHHTRAVTGLWLASLHDRKRGTCEVSQSASYLARHEPLLDVRGSARAFTTTRIRGRAGAFPTNRTRCRVRAFPTIHTRCRVRAFPTTRTGGRAFPRTRRQRRRPSSAMSIFAM
jgi:hypothetical protein